MKYISSEGIASALLIKVTDRTAVVRPVTTCRHVPVTPKHRLLTQVAQGRYHHFVLINRAPAYREIGYLDLPLSLVSVARLAGSTSCR